MSRIIGIVSGKGGVGKTTLCAGLGFALANRNKNVIAIDGDIGLKNLDILLGMSDNTAYDLTDILSGRCTVSKAIQVNHNYEKLHFISASQNAEAEDIDRKAFSRLCKHLRFYYDYVLIDAPAGLGSGFKNIIECCDECIIVATSDHTSIRDAQKTADIAANIPGLNTHLVLNKISPSMISKGYLDNIDDIIDSISVPLLGMLPSDDAVVVYSNMGKPIIDTKSVCAGPISNIAGRLTGENIPLDKYWRKK